MWMQICRSSLASTRVGYLGRVWAETRSNAGGVRNGFIRNAVGLRGGWRKIRVIDAPRVWGKVAQKVVGRNRRWCLRMAAVWSAWIGFDTWMTCWEQQGAVERRLGLDSEGLGDSSKSSRSCWAEEAYPWSRRVGYTGRVQSVMVYASETWAVRAEEEQRMERNEHVILRWMCGVTLIFDKDLSAKKQISSVCKSLYFQIRQLRQVCSSLDKNSVIVLANSLVSSKLDYCSLQLPLIIFRQFPSSYNLPAVFLDRLQKVQNALARVVVPSVRRHHHITPTLKDLDWLSNSATFIPLWSHYPLHPNQKFKIPWQIPPHSHICSASGRRSFSFAAPFIWNSLLLPLRSCPTVPLFLSYLKAHLFLL